MSLAQFLRFLTDERFRQAREQPDGTNLVVNATA